MDREGSVPLLFTIWRPSSWRRDLMKNAAGEGKGGWRWIYLSTVLVDVCLNPSLTHTESPDGRLCSAVRRVKGDTRALGGVFMSSPFIKAYSRLRDATMFHKP